MIYNNEQCGFDGGDCPEIDANLPTLAPTEESTASDDVVDMYPNCSFFTAFIGDGECDVYLNSTECGFDGGDCDKFCDAVNGGCDVFNRLFPDCVPDKTVEQWYGNIEDGTTNEIELMWPYWLKDGLCDAICEYKYNMGM
jgi:LNR domain